MFREYSLERQPSFRGSIDKTNQLQQNIFLFISLVSSSIITFRWSSKEGSKGFQTAGGDGGLGGSLLCAAWCKEEKTQDKSQPDGGSASWEGSWEKALGTKSN